MFPLSTCFFFQKITTKIYEFEGGSGSFMIEEIEFLLHHRQTQKLQLWLSVRSRRRRNKNYRSQALENISLF